MSVLSITPFLWFDANAEDAIKRYQSVFPDTEVIDEQRHPDGSLFIGTIKLHGTDVTLMNAGPHYKLSEAFSFAVTVDSQEDVDRISDALIAGGGNQSQCGWLVDAFGLSWQIVPKLLFDLMGDPDREKAGRVQEAMMQMTRLDSAALQAAYDG